MIGWIKLHREISKHWIYPSRRKFTEYEAWLDLLMRTNWKEGKAKIDKTVVEVDRGQFITSQLKLSIDWMWSRSETRNFLNMLEKDKMIDRQSTTKYTMITICNFDSYQEAQPTNDQSTTSEETTGGHQGDTIEEEKETQELQEGKDKSPPIKKFVKPTIEEVKAYCFLRAKGINAQIWMDRYISNGWKVGKTSMKDWKASVRTWENNNLNKGNDGSIKENWGKLTVPEPGSSSL